MRERIADLHGVRADLAAFLAALQAADATGGPAARRAQLPPRRRRSAIYDAETRAALAALEAGSTVPPRRRLGGRAGCAAGTGRRSGSTATSPPATCWSATAACRAVIDFGTCGVGDPACDLAIAWTFLYGRSRAAFRAGLGLDAATWARGRGWALWKALITLANPGAVRWHAESARVVDLVLAEHSG